MNASQNRLTALTKQLAAEWAQTRQYWADAKSQEFEKRFLDELMADVNQAVASMITLEQVLTRVRNDCE